MSSPATPLITNITIKSVKKLFIMEKLNFCMEKNWKEVLVDMGATKEERIQAAFHLEDAGDDDSIKTMGDALFTEPSPIVRHEIAFALGECAHPEIASKYLMKSVEEDENIFVRHESILALATLGKKEYIPFVKRFLNEPELEMRESAEIALERLENTGQ